MTLTIHVVEKVNTIDKTKLGLHSFALFIYEESWHYKMIYLQQFSALTLKKLIDLQKEVDDLEIFEYTTNMPTETDQLMTEFM